VHRDVGLGPAVGARLGESEDPERVAVGSGAGCGVVDDRGDLPLFAGGGPPGGAVHGCLFSLLKQPSQTGLPGRYGLIPQFAQRLLM
jgi:hypothetical protein